MCWQFYHARKQSFMHFTFTSLHIWFYLDMPYCNHQQLCCCFFISIDYFHCALISGRYTKHFNMACDLLFGWDIGHYHIIISRFNILYFYHFMSLLIWFCISCRQRRADNTCSLKSDCRGHEIKPPYCSYTCSILT